MSYKISDVTKALKKAGFVKLDAEDAIFGGNSTRKSFFRYKGGLTIRGNKIGFSINNAADAKIFGKYAIDAEDTDGSIYERWMDWAELFFPRLFGYLNGTITEDEIVKEICA